MKVITFNFKGVVMAVVALLALTSCSDDYTEPTVYYSARATVTSEEGEVLTLRTDGGNVLTVVSDYSGYTPETDQRTMITYSIENGDNNYYNADLHGVYNLLTKDVVKITAENEAQFGDDPVHLYAAWCAGGYLNVNFGFNTSGSVIHYVNLAENTLVQHPEDGKIYLEFRHNAMGDNEKYGKRGTACFDLAKYQDGNNILTFVVKFTAFNGVTPIREIQYDFMNDTVISEEDPEIGEGLYE